MKEQIGTYGYKVNGTLEVGDEISLSYFDGGYPKEVSKAADPDM
jgi:hypothetical protein